MVLVGDDSSHMTNLRFSRLIAPKLNSKALRKPEEIPGGSGKSFNHRLHRLRMVLVGDDSSHPTNLRFSRLIAPKLNNKALRKPVARK
jgi:hypothetical protein